MNLRAIKQLIAKRILKGTVVVGGGASVVGSIAYLLVYVLAII